MKTKLIIASFAICGIAKGQTPNWEWAKSGCGAGHDYGRSISTDPNGNCYATGYFQVPSIVFGDDTLTGSTNYHDNFYLVKYDHSGNELWAKSAGDQNNAYGSCINTDANGNSYVTGYFEGSGTINFGSYTLVSSNGGQGDAFVVKYDSSGNVGWATIAGSSNGGDFPYSGADAYGNVYVVLGLDSSHNFISKLDNSGNLIWQKNVSGNYRTPNICTDMNGNSYVTGCFISPTMIFGSDTVTNSSNGWIIFVVKYDSAGNVVWAKSAGTYASLYIPSISVDGSGNTYVTGYFNGMYAQFGSTILTNAGIDDIFIVKFDSSGNVVWAKRAGGPDFDQGHCIKTDPNGNSYLTGLFRSYATFGSINLFSTGVTDVFVVKYDSAGNALWAQQAGGIYPDEGNGIGINANGNIYVTGSFFSPNMNFGNITKTNCDITGNSAEVFVAKLNDIPTVIGEDYNLPNTENVYPNPFSTQTTLQSNKILKNALLTVYNLDGDRVKQIKNISGRSIIIHRENLPSGIYFIRLMQDNKIIITKKLIIMD